LSDITLYHFRSSHYNEKARWALDLKGVDHERISLTPGPHAPRMKRLTGDTKTPALVDGDEVVTGSTAILRHLEGRFPEPALEPSDAGLRERAFAWVHEFDDEVGPAVRVAKFFETLSTTYAIRTFCYDKNALARAAYRMIFPLVAQVMRRSMSIDAEHAARGRVRTLRALEKVSEQAGPSGYLVGDRFSIADLVCAALLMPAVDVSDLGGPPAVGTDAERQWFARWSDHPGAAWVRETYRRHRMP